MATFVNERFRSFPAGADLSSNQYKFHKLNSSGQAVIASTLGEQVKGVLANKPAASGEPAALYSKDEGSPAKITLAEAAVVGSPLTTDASGDAILADTIGHEILAYAEEAGASGDIIRCSLVSGNQSVPADEYGEFSVGDTGAIFTMAATAALLVVGNDVGTGEDFAKSLADNVLTSSLTAGTFTVVKAGSYELYMAGQITGEEDEDVTIEWHKNDVALGEPAKALIEFDATTSSALIQQFSHKCTVALAAGDEVHLEVLGSDDEVITFKRFNFGVRAVAA